MATSAADAMMDGVEASTPSPKPPSKPLDEDADSSSKSIIEEIAGPSSCNSSASSPARLLETTIQRMQDNNGLCFDPVHYHSFRSLLVPPLFQNCYFCHQRIQMMLLPFHNDGGSAGGTDGSAVKCMACQAVAHRSCALSKHNKPPHSSDDNGVAVIDDAHKCPVNWEIVQKQLLQQPESTTTTSIPKKNKKDEATDEKEQQRPPDDSSSSFPAAMIQALQENVMNSYNREQNHHRRRPRVVAPYPAVRTHKDKRKPPSPPVVVQQQPSASLEEEKLEKEEKEAQTTKEISSGVASQPESAADDASSSSSSGHNNNNKNLAQHLADNINVGILAGSLAGGVAGLALAGPAGAYAGYVTAGGLLVEGGVAWSLVAAGIGVGGLAGQQQHQKNRLNNNKRVLELAGGGHVVLVRPSVQVDPIWNKFYAEARKLAPAVAKQRRNNANQRDRDIYQTSENEIDTNDKILLLVNRTLNDKHSPSGHVFRHLVQVFHDRCQIRNRLCKTNDSIAGVSPRAKRDDVHAVIKFVTASLMDERPELGLQAHFTELTATAVESLVFALLYDTVFEEIVEETSGRDIDLWRKITTFEQQCRGARASLQSLVSESAVEALKLLPASHSTGEKLVFCVKFLDAVSEHFVTVTAHHKKRDAAAAIGADSLIKMVCQHLVLIGNSISCHAQVAFLEEFSRDEELLRGREGYALVTLQACLHILQSSTDLQADVFYNDDGDNDSTLPQVVTKGSASSEKAAPGRCRSLSTTDDEDVSHRDDSEADGRPESSSTCEPLKEVSSSINTVDQEGSPEDDDDATNNNTVATCSVATLATGVVHSAGASDLAKADDDEDDEDDEAFFDAECHYHERIAI